MSEPMPPNYWADIVIARMIEAVNSLPVTKGEAWQIRAMIADTLPRITYAHGYLGPRSACGCPDRDEDYAPHPDEPCDWSHWHPNNHHPDALREDRFCWKCGAMEMQTMDLER